MISLYVGSSRIVAWREVERKVYWIPVGQCRDHHPKEPTSKKVTFMHADEADNNNKMKIERART
jgi:hypothetical protein